ncbi:MAG: Gfo/Idh/MocA family oxidoreductase [Spirochaetales bacterium]|nr:Gfo/Idh/MocA family oxidoreductase [Spirochaetales bacterium]
MKTLNVGVIGAGGRGGLSRQVKEVAENVCLIAAADVKQQVLDKFKADHDEDVFATTDYKALLDRKDVDAVFICTPDYLHEEHAVAALEAGKAVYLEKPIAITIEGADRILETARRTGSRLYLGHNMRYFPSILAMKKLLDEGAIGKLQAVWCRHFVSIGGDAYYKDWHSERKNSTGLLLQKGAHDIDVIHWLAGAYSKSVVAMGRLSVYDQATRRAPDKEWKGGLKPENWPPLAQDDYSENIDVEDHNMVLMQLANGVQASYVQCHYAPDYWRNYTFIGSEGRIENDGDSGSCEIHIFNSRTNTRHMPNEVVKLEPEEGSHGGSDPAIVRSFIDFVREGKKPNTSPVAARYSVAAGVQATLSLRNGNGLKEVPLLDPSLEKYFEDGQ